MEHNKGEPAPLDTWLCAPLKVSAVTCNPEDAEYGRLLEFSSVNGVPKKWAMPMDLLAGDGIPVLERLLSEGLKAEPASRKQILHYIACSEPAKRLKCANHTGWHSSRTFVLPDEVIGPDSIWLQSVTRIAAYDKAGTLDGWRTEIATYATGNPYLMFSLSFALCGPLLERLTFPGGGIHFYGDSTIGKTTDLLAAASVWGHGERYLRTWRATANGLEGVGVQHTDTLLALDEIANIGARDLNEVAYFLTDGQGKTRANKYGEARAVAQWRIALLSSGEQSIRAKLSEGGFSTKAGQGLRILDVPADRGKHGIFDELHGHENAAALADAIRHSSCKHYEHAGPAFIRYLIDKPISEFRDALQKTSIEYGELKGQERRAARVFTLAGLAGQLAHRAGLVPWQERDSLEAAHQMFDIWRETRETSALGAEHHNILGAIKDFIDRHGDSRFAPLAPLPSAPVVRDRAGYWTDDHAPDGSRLRLFTSGGLKEATRGFDFQRVLRALDQADAFFKKGPKQKSVSTRTPEGPSALYWIDCSKLQ